MPSRSRAARSSTWSVTPREHSASATIGTKRSAAAACTSSVSIALHTDGRLTFASTAMRVAISRSASASMYVWHTPMPPATTGIVASSRTRRMRSAPPRGTMRSIDSCARSSAPTSSRSVDSMNCTQPAGSPAASASRATMPASTPDVSCASLPERSTTALPDFRQMHAMSTVTFGRDS